MESESRRRSPNEIFRIAEFEDSKGLLSHPDVRSIHFTCLFVPNIRRANVTYRRHRF